VETKSSSILHSLIRRDRKSCPIPRRNWARHLPIW
jgi:hypothetical protein